MAKVIDPQGRGKKVQSYRVISDEDFEVLYGLQFLALEDGGLRLGEGHEVLDGHHPDLRAGACDEADEL